ncbi:MAG: polysaccharide deacetylase family protein [Algisphaera sp.]
MPFASPWITTLAPAAVLGAAVGLYGIIHPRSSVWGPVVSRVKRRMGQSGPPRVALTFDDGPTAQSTPAVLDALAKAGVSATFFVVGQNIRDHPALLQRAHDEGHLIANHTFSHPRQGLWGRRAYWRRQLDACDDAIFDVIGKRPSFFRPPMGLKHWHMLKEVTYGGQHTVTWSRRARDGNITATPKGLIRRLLKHIRDGDILLLHDGHEPDHPGTRQHTADAIVSLAKQLRDRGYDIVRLDELLDLPGYLDTEPNLGTQTATPSDNNSILPSLLRQT